MNILKNNENRNDFNSIEIKKIETIINSNATEDLEKVKNCIKNLIPKNFKLKNQFIKEVSGGYNNPIKILKLNFNNSDDIEYIINILCKKISLFEKKKLFQEFNNRLSSKNVFYIRLKKSLLAREQIILYDKSDVIKISIAFYNPRTGSQKKINPEKIKKYLIKKELIAEL